MPSNKPNPFIPQGEGGDTFKPKVPNKFINAFGYNWKDVSREKFDDFIRTLPLDKQIEWRKLNLSGTELVVDDLINFTKSISNAAFFNLMEATDPRVKKDLDRYRKEHPVISKVSDIGGSLGGGTGAAAKIGGKVFQKIIPKGVTRVGKYISDTTKMGMEAAGGAFTQTVTNADKWKKELEGNPEADITDITMKMLTDGGKDAGIAMTAGTVFGAFANKARLKRAEYDQVLNEAKSEMKIKSLGPTDAQTNFGKFLNLSRKEAPKFKEQFGDDIEIVLGKDLERGGSFEEVINEINEKRQSLGKEYKNWRSSLKEAVPSGSIDEILNPLKDDIAEAELIGGDVGIRQATILKKKYKQISDMIYNKRPDGSVTQPTLDRLEFVREKLNELEKAFGTAVGKTPEKTMIAKAAAKIKEQGDKLSGGKVNDFAKRFRAYDVAEGALNKNIQSWKTKNIQIKPSEAPGVYTKYLAPLATPLKWAAKKMSGSTERDILDAIGKTSFPKAGLDKIKQEALENIEFDRKVLFGEIKAPKNYVEAILPEPTKTGQLISIAHDEISDTDSSRDIIGIPTDDEVLNKLNEPSTGNVISDDDVKALLGEDNEQVQLPETVIEVP